MDDKITTRELALTKRQISDQSNSLDLLPQNPDDRLKFLKELAQGANTGVTTIGDAILVAATAKELGIGLGAAMRNINVIKGKVTLSYHVLKALMARYSNIINYYRSIDYQPVYLYITADNLSIGGNELPTNARIVPLSNLAADVPPIGQFNVAIVPEIINSKATGKPMIIDWVTEYTFERVIPDIRNVGRTTIKTIKSRYSLNQARVEGIYKEGGAWDKMGRTMTDKSSFVYGCRDIADDIISGMYASFEFDADFVDTVDIDVEEEQK
jgi:hypothetical protein